MEMLFIMRNLLSGLVGFPSLFDDTIIYQYWDFVNNIFMCLPPKEIKMKLG